LYYPKEKRNQRSSITRPLLLLAGSLTGCVVEQNYYYPSSTGEDGGPPTPRQTPAPAPAPVLPRFLTFKAWLSTLTMSAANRLLHSQGRYVLVNGLVVAQNWDALTSGILENAIMVDEKSMTQNALVWTGTLASGQPALGSEFCEDWDDDSGLLKLGGSGVSASTDATWSFFDHNGCGSETHLYCVEQ
jgi:hypothetical protein